MGGKYLWVLSESALGNDRAQVGQGIRAYLECSGSCWCEVYEIVNFSLFIL